MSTSSISVCVATYNAETYLDKCLSSVQWCDEIVVVDLGSTDRTLEIAESFNCRTVKRAWVPVVEMIRNEMISFCTSNWILLLDPDEVVPPMLADKLRQVAVSDKVDAVSIPRKNYIFGRWIAHSGWNKDRHIRFFRKGAVSWSTEVHHSSKSLGRMLELPDAEEYRLVHLAYDSVTQFVQKLDRYTNAEAEKPANLRSGKSADEMMYAPFAELSRRYFCLEGYKDGVRGLAASMLMAFYWATTSLKVAERNGWSTDDSQQLSQSRKGVMRGMAELLKCLYGSAETWPLRLVYGVLWSAIALALRIRAF
jgi:glycosyltransferase involved in cell wall biosynthesis